MFICQSRAERLHREAQSKWKTDYCFYHRGVRLPSFKMQSPFHTCILPGTFGSPCVRICKGCMSADTVLEIHKDKRVYMIVLDLKNVRHWLSPSINISWRNTHIYVNELEEKSSFPGPCIIFVHCPPGKDSAGTCRTSTKRSQY